MLYSWWFIHLQEGIWIKSICFIIDTLITVTLLSKPVIEKISQSHFLHFTHWVPHVRGTGRNFPHSATKSNCHSLSKDSETSYKAMPLSRYPHSNLQKITKQNKLNIYILINSKATNQFKSIHIRGKIVRSCSSPSRTPPEGMWM
jgi:hypothetical protein